MTTRTHRIMRNDDLLLTVLAAQKVTLRTVAKLVATTDRKSERIVLSHLTGELNLEKEELAKEFSVAKIKIGRANQKSRMRLELTE